MLTKLVGSGSQCNNFTRKTLQVFSPTYLIAFKQANGTATGSIVATAETSAFIYQEVTLCIGILRKIFGDVHITQQVFGQGCIFLFYLHSSQRRNSLKTGNRLYQ